VDKPGQAAAALLRVEREYVRFALGPKFPLREPVLARTTLVSGLRGRSQAIAQH
jgi:hypothetical protein